MKGITDAQLTALHEISGLLEPGTYLAGGVAIATAYGHRLSLDIDLFVPADFDPERIAERLTAAISDLRVTGRASGTLHFELGSVPTSLLRYRYGLLAPAERRDPLPVPVASMQDLACMKVSAIAGRGAAKDFWDLYVLMEHGIGGGKLGNLLDSYRRKFPVEDVGHAVRSLAYFGDADAAPLPAGLSNELWSHIKDKIADEVRKL